MELQQLAVLQGHVDRVWAVAWSPAGDKLASCSGDKTVRIWQRRSPAAAGGGGGEWCCSAVLEHAHTRTVRSVCWNPTGRALVTGSFDAKCSVWELAGGVWEQVAELEGHDNEVKCVAWNPDGRLIATCGRDRSVWIWESLPGHEFACVDVKQGQHTQDVKAIAWHPGGELLASASYDDTIRLWSTDGDEWFCSQTLGGAGAGHTSTVWSVAWDSAGERLASCSDDRTVRVWQQQVTPGTDPAHAPRMAAQPNLRCAATISGYHNRTVYSVDWSSRGVLATGDGDDAIMVFGQGDPELAACGMATNHDGGRAGAEEEPAPRANCSNDDSITSRPAPSAEAAPTPWCAWAVRRKAHDSDVNCVRWHPSDPWLLASCGDDGAVKLWRLVAR